MKNFKNDYNNPIKGHDCNLLVSKVIVNLIKTNILTTIEVLKSPFKRDITAILSLLILSHSKVARIYLKNKYQIIYIDEYQDNSRDTNNLIRFWKTHVNHNLIIGLFGDDKQLIYSFLGASKNELTLWNNAIDNKYTLTNNFRTPENTQNIISYLESNSNQYYEFNSMVNNRKSGEFLSISDFTEMTILVKNNYACSNIIKKLPMFKQYIRPEIEQKIYNENVRIFFLVLLNIKESYESTNFSMESVCKIFFEDVSEIVNFKQVFFKVVKKEQNKEDILDYNSYLKDEYKFTLEEFNYLLSDIEKKN